MDATAIGSAIGKSAKTGRRFLEDWTGEVFLVRGRRYIREIDFLKWLEGRKIQPRTESRPSPLRDVLAGIADETLAKRRRAS